jgi:hypothetical protein
MEVHEIKGESIRDLKSFLERNNFNVNFGRVFSKGTIMMYAYNKKFY